MPDGISIEDYLKYLEQQNTSNTDLSNVESQMVGSTVSAPAEDDWTSAFGPPTVQKVKSENAALDFLGQLTWGAVSGLTWGATEFVEKSKPWEQMNDWERAGWVTGEGLSLFTPIVGPFALLGKGGQVATKALRGNNYIRKAASDLVPFAAICFPNKLLYLFKSFIDIPSFVNFSLISFFNLTIAGKSKAPVF